MPAYTDLAASIAKAGAPILATAIGGPIGAVANIALTALAAALGVAANPDAVKAAIEADPSAAATAINEVENSQGAALNELQLRMADVENARELQIAAMQAGDRRHSAIMHVLAVSLVLMFGASLFALYTRGAPENNLAMMLFGALISEVRGVLAYYFGSSVGSREKDATLVGLSNFAQQSVKRK